jgi:hypothetical protein
MNFAIRREWLLSVCLMVTIATITTVRLAAQAPGATVTAVDAKTGVVTAKVNSTGQVFTFTLTNRALISHLRPGQGVYVNLGKKQVSLDGKSTSGTILTLPQLGKTGSGSTGGQSGSTNSSTSGNSGNSGTTNPQPVTASCGGTANPLSSDTCGKAFSLATNVGSVGCGASITVTGNVYPVGSSDFLEFTVPASRANCVDYSGRTQSPYIQVTITSNPTNAIVFDALAAPDTPVTAGNSTGQFGPAAAVGDFFAELGTAYSPLMPGTYYIRVYGVKASTTGTWTLMLKG